MVWIQSRIGRARSFGRWLVGLVLLSVSLFTAIVFWWDKLGFWGMGVIGAVVFCLILVAFLVPDTVWRRLTGTEGIEELGRLHEEGVALRRRRPWLKDADGAAELDEYEAEVEEWANRVYEALPARWRGTFLTSVPTTRYTALGYSRASRLENWLDDRLERLSQIMSAMPGSG